MALPRMSFGEVLAHYPVYADDFGDEGRIVSNPAYRNSCALRLSTALESASPGFLSQFSGNRAVHLQGRAGHYTRVEMPYARSAQGLANYLGGVHVGWVYQRLESRAEAMRLSTQGIIFWKVRHGSDSPNHIDLWDPLMRGLRAGTGRTMLWVPQADIVEYAWFWELKRGIPLSPPSMRHSLQSG